ncbi:MAG: PLDc N-terminal domain-containing protein [Candidatus Nanoarchaeia archaeon]
MDGLGLIVGFYGLFFFVAVIVLLSIVSFGFWLWMLIDCLTRKRWKGNEQVVWALVIVFLNLLGAVIYFFVVKAGRK